MNIKDVCEELKNYVTIDRFSPVEKGFYGLVTLICTSVVIALLSLVLKK